MIESSQLISFYQLVDPRDNVPFYVGQTIDPARRLKDYLDRPYQHGRAVDRRLRELKALGLVPVMQELEQRECTQNEANEREIYWITTLKSQGYSLLNKSNGQRGRLQQTIYLPPDLSDWIRVQAARQHREISEIVEEALIAYRDLQQAR